MSISVSEVPVCASLRLFALWTLACAIVGTFAVQHNVEWISDSICPVTSTRAVRPAWVEGLACGRHTGLVVSEGLYGHSGAFQALHGEASQRLPAATFAEGIAYEPSSATYFQLTLDDGEVWRYSEKDLAVVGRIPLPGAVNGPGTLLALQALDDGTHNEGPAQSFQEQLERAGVHPEDAALAAELAALSGNAHFGSISGRNLEQTGPVSNSPGGEVPQASAAEVQAIKQAWGLAFDSHRRIMWLSDGSLRLHALASDMSAQLATVAVSFPPGVPASCPSPDTLARSWKGEQRATAGVEVQPIRLNELEYIPASALEHAFAAAAAATAAARTATDRRAVHAACMKRPSWNMSAGAKCEHIPPPAQLPLSLQAFTPAEIETQAGEIWAAVPGCVAILRISACDFRASGWLDFTERTALRGAVERCSSIGELPLPLPAREQSAADAPSEKFSVGRLPPRSRRRKRAAQEQGVLAGSAGNDESVGNAALANACALIADANCLSVQIERRARREGHLNGLALCSNAEAGGLPQFFIAGKHWTALLQSDLASVLIAGEPCLFT